MTTIDGIPAHALLVHVVVVVIPLSAVLLVVIALWPAARRRLAGLTAILAALALISIPITTDAGEWLEHHVARTALVHAHTHLGDTMLPWGIALFVVAAVIAVREVLLVRNRRRTDAESARSSASASAVGGSATHGVGGVVATVGLAVLAVVVALGSTVTVYRIGESGARAAWTGHFNAQANPPRPHHPNG
jgi:hypothetical protein